MSNKLFFGNLDWNTEKDEVHTYFAPFGEIVEISIAIDKDSGRSRGFGFVTYDSEESAVAAVEGLDGEEFKGRKLGVKVADTNKERAPRNKLNGNNGHRNNENGNGSNYNGYKNNGNGNGYGNGYKNYSNNYRNGGFNSSNRGNNDFNEFNNRREYSPRYKKRGHY